MLPSLLLGAALAAPAAPMPRDAVAAPVGPAPWVVLLKADANDRVALTVYKPRTINRTRIVNGVRTQEKVETVGASQVILNDLGLSFTTAQGTPLATAAVFKQAKDGLVALVSVDGKPVDKGWLRAAAPDTVVVAAEPLASSVVPRSPVAVPTAGPRLVLLGTGADGKVQVAYNPNPAGDGSGVNRVAAIQAKQMVLLANGGGVVQQQFFLDDGSAGPNPSTPLAAVPTKPLGDLKFDAYDLTGKLVARDEAVKRLTAGGLVLVAGDDRVPDATFLKAFRGDLLVLVSPELVNVPTGSGKPGIAVPGQAAPAPAPVPVPLPAVQPARPILRVAPAVLKVKPLPAAVPQQKPAEQKAVPDEKNGR